MKNKSGQVLVGVMAVVLFIMIMLPPLVNWIQDESRWTVKEQKSTLAFNVAEAGIDRGVWKLKSTTSTWSAAMAGTAVTGYDFDATYNDVAGGSYRIRFSAGPGANQVTVLAEGRDTATEEVRALQAIFQNQALPGALIANGIMTYHGAFEAHWGPVMAHNNIVISGNAATEYFPRKFSKQVVLGTAGQPRDTNGITPPNTDNVEWWSDYDVAELPLLDFTTLRASAAANGTLNYYTTSGSEGAGKCMGWAGHGTCRTYTGANTWAGDHRGRPHFHDSNHHALSRQNLIWYWDGDLILTGDMSAGNHRNGLWGTLIVRGNLTIDTGDGYAFSGPVPASAWMEYKRIKPSTWDTSATNQYPADDGYQVVRSTFNYGSESWTGGPPAANTDVGLRGLVYVGGNLTINSVTDISGVVWVVGNVTNNATGERVLVFYDSSLQVPTLNVVLVRQSWREVAPSADAWL
ncbi:MAG: hypothetical protein A2992_09505 [Elusimicrobia bacterium RIFCSPLOWO2_01_FULL_59_12]|nr:MAG: hypothetical protein A2992_09505 [Elusimicrobia bacterium RIFCSPLOWO2_01_FULL_59_12]